VDEALRALEDTARAGQNIMPASIRAAKVGVTTGEWSGVLRRVFGEFRAPTGLQGAGAAPQTDILQALRDRTMAVADRIGHPLKLLVGKPGLDGHSNGAEQIAVRAKDAGFEVIYQGIRLTPEQIVSSAIEEDVDAIGISIHSGSHMTLVPRIVELLRENQLGDIPLVVGGVIPDADRARLAECGVARVYTPGEKTLSEIVGEIVDLVGARAA
jgi:(2R)-ethylmalonyl-CoA mutase